MQVPLTPKDHIPAPNCLCIPIRLPLPDLRYPLWNHRLLESFEKDFSKGRLVHQAYYRPFATLSNNVPSPPYLIAGDHLFEWIHSHHTFPTCVVLFTVNPLTHSPTPADSVDRHTICQEYVYMVHLFPSLLPFLFLSQPILTGYTPFTLYLSTRTYLQSFVLCAPFPTRPRHCVTKRVTFPFLFIPRPLDDRGPFLFHRCLPSSLTYPQARPP